MPDPDLLDCNGQGSHVAGTASGLGVNADGTTFLGPYDGSTPFASFGIGPGVAPRRIIDNGEPGLIDRFGLRITSPTGAILLDLTFDPIQLSGGNFSVHKLTGK